MTELDNAKLGNTDWNNFLRDKIATYLNAPRQEYVPPASGAFQVSAGGSQAGTGVQALSGGVGTALGGGINQVTTPWYSPNLYTGADGRVVQGMNPLTTGFGIAQGLGQLWLGNQAMELGRDNYNLQKSTTEANLYNQGRLINAGLEDKARARHYNYGGTAEGEAGAVQSMKDQYGARTSLS